ncbi:hypothetical protein GCM10009785_11250 [Brooklawnia cerclae]
MLAHKALHDIAAEPEAGALFERDDMRLMLGQGQDLSRNGLARVHMPTLPRRGARAFGPVDNSRRAIAED